MRKARTVAKFLRDVSASKAAQANYRHRAAELRAMAHQMESEGKSLSARYARYHADVADHAARAEFFDPEP